MNTVNLRRGGDCGAAARGLISHAKISHNVMALALSAALAGLGGVSMATPALAQQSAAATHEYAIPAGSLREALDTLGQQSNVAIVFSPDLVDGKRTHGVTGRFTPAQALRRLLEGSGLELTTIDDATYVLKAAPNVPSKERSSQSHSPSASRRDQTSLDDKEIVGMPAIMVKGARTLNMDIERTVDDPQPYVVFDRATIERAGAVNLNDFMKTRLPMNTDIRSTTSSSPIYTGVNSGVNLRGLGNTQTLILVDGRRLAESAFGGSGQPDINGIPMEAIERIEVLPSTASAIYGGSATGGVINIIMRRDFVGTQVTINYDNSFDTDSAISRIDLSSGFSLFGGKTRVLVSGSYSESNDLLIKDRVFNQRGQSNVRKNNPLLYSQALRPLNGSGANVVSADGTTLVMKDGSSLNSSFTYAPDGYLGASSDGGAVLLANAGNWAPGSIDSLSTPGDTLIASPLVKYFSGSVHHEFNENLNGFLEGSRSDNSSHVRMMSDNRLWRAFLPADAPTNPFQQAVLINTTSKQMDGYVDQQSISDRFSSGLVFRLPGQWMASADYTFGKSKRSFVVGVPYADNSILNPAYADGSIDLLRDLDTQDLSPYILSPLRAVEGPYEVATKNPAVRLSGPIASLKSGTPRVSMLLERQDTSFKSSSGWWAGIPAEFISAPDRSRIIDSAYIELQIPFISSLNKISWIEELELQLAGRWDQYKTTNAAIVAYYPPEAPPPFEYIQNEVSEFSPLAAIRFRPNKSLTLRASYSEGFLPPSIDELTSPYTLVGYGNTIGTVIDPRRGGTMTSSYSSEVLITGGGNPDLGPEYSTTRSVGIIYTPQWIEGLRISIDYTNLKKKEAITSIGYQVLLDNEEYFPGRVTRGPNMATDPEGWAGPIVGLDTSLINSARMNLEAYDVKLDYTLYTSKFGSFSLFALATWQTRFDVQLVPSASFVDSLGWVSGFSAPMDLKGNVGAAWDFDPWTLGWTMRYASSYYVANPAATTSHPRLLAQGNGGRVPSQMYHDLFAKYRFESGSWRSRTSNILDGMEIQVGVRNVFNKTPPYDYSYGGSYYSGFGDPRLATYYITLRQNF